MHGAVSYSWSSMHVYLHILGVLTVVVPNFKQSVAVYVQVLDR